MVTGAWKNVASDLHIHHQKASTCHDATSKGSQVTALGCALTSVPLAAYRSGRINFGRLLQEISSLRD